MTDSENRKVLGVIVECAKMTPEIFTKTVEEMTKTITNNEPQGKTSLNKLAKTGKIESVKVSDDNIGGFAQTARKYNLTYSLKRIRNGDDKSKKQYLICFHGRDLDTVKKAVFEFCNQKTEKETLFSKKKISEIQVSVPERENDGRTRERTHKKERSGKQIER